MWIVIKPRISFSPLLGQRGMTLVEVAIALTIAAMVFAGVIGGLVQSRRMTDGSVAQNSALAAVQGYLEQMKNMPLKGGYGTSTTNLINSDGNGNPQLTVSYLIPTEQDDSNGDYLKTSTGIPPDISTLTAGTTPTGVGIIDNMKDIAADPTNTGPNVTWASIWPNADYGNAYISPSPSRSNNPFRNDLHLNIWVWVADLTPTYISSEKCYGITIIYTWSFWDGIANHYYIGTIRTTRSAVPTYN